MDRESREKGLDLDAILNEFAPTAAEEKSPAPSPAAPAEEPPRAPEPPAEEAAAPAAPVQEAPAPAEPPKAPETTAVRRRRPSRPTPKEEVEEPTLRLVARDGRLVEEGPREDLSGATRRIPRAPGGEKGEKGPEKRPEKKKEKGRKDPWWKRRRKERTVHRSEKVIEFPEEDHSVPGRIGRLMERADRYAENMFEGDRPPDPEEEERERLLPGVDYEDEPTHAPSPRRPRRVRRPKPDTPPGELAKKYKKGLTFLHTRIFLTALLCIPQIYVTVMGMPDWGPLSALGTEPALAHMAEAAALGVTALMALDVVIQGLKDLVTFHWGGETLLLFATAAGAADALTISRLGSGERGSYCGVVAAAYVFALLGRFLKLRGLRQSCRVADSASEPYLVTLDERVWNGADAYTKWSGETEGYGSQIQESDGAQRVYRVAAPLLVVAALVLSLLASVGNRRPELFFWCLSATMTAGCGFAGFLAFAGPFDSLSRRLGKVGAALGGWDSLSWSGKHTGAVLTDGDLFPPGSVTLNGIKLCGQISMETAVSYAASLVKETGSEMEKPFRDMLRAQSGVYRKCTQVVRHEGGVTGLIGGQNVCVGSSAFMEIMHVRLPQGLKVKNAVFCAVEGDLEAIFALNYRLHPAIRPSLDMLIANGVDPILATRDFLVIPDMLRQKFKLPVDRMEFPSLDRRRDLSAHGLSHAKELGAVLCREGLGPYAEAMVAGKRLVSATRVGITFSLLGSAVGLVLAFYLTAAQAFASLSGGALLAFLLLWTVPAILVWGWTNRY